jgi:hypothetical protein
MRCRGALGCCCAFDAGERINAGEMIPSDKVVVRLLKPARHVPQ